MLRVPITGIFLGASFVSAEIPDTLNELPYAEYVKTPSCVFNEKMEPLFQFKLKKIYVPEMVIKYE